ncbi:protein KINESIN LIGHT CHAIN-RELATED 1 [Selaginella moellendorffii]|nr:protein KINESIN LIGHT CHAIN-RELATED 1 [Selaginella moellendorffii]|eukprot:XP_002970481.2 protein KINESIN LIGHT CHAIN-RELATED 1 [Selaginella moellendorffii]
MPSLVTDNARKAASPPGRKGVKGKEETKNKASNASSNEAMKISAGRNSPAGKNSTAPSDSEAIAPGSHDENEGSQELNDVVESSAENPAISPEESEAVSRENPAEAKFPSQAKGSVNSRLRNSLDKKPPVRASPPTPPRKQKSPSKPLTRKSIKSDSPPKEPSKQLEQEAVESDAGLDEQETQQQHHPKLVNSNALNLLRLARASHIAGDNPLKAIDYASRAATLFEKEDGEVANLELVLCLHIVAAGYCRLGRYDEAIKVLESSLLIPSVDQGSEHALAVFAGHMQLGDTLSLVGKHEMALASYHNALDVQKQVLGDMDPRVAETCRYLSEAHLQVMQFDEAQQLCKHVLDIHSQHSPAGSVDEAIDRKLMALIHAGKGEHEMALEHLVLASTTLSCNGQDLDVASVDCSIGEAYFALGRYDEAVFSYQKALTILKSAKGDSHTAVAAVYVSLADLYLKTGRQREAKTYCENALKIFGKNNAGHELSSGLVEVAGVYEAMGEREQALSLLKRALDILQLAPGEQSAAAGVEAQMGVLLYVMGKFSEAYTAFNSAILKLKFGTDRETTFLGVLFNQLALASVELQQLDNAVKHFEEAKRILEKAVGPHHAETLAVSSNLAGCYDALGRVNDAIALLENVVEIKEELLGTVHPDVARDRERLLALLKGVGRSRARKTSTLEELLLLPNPEAAIT